jgi:hypothetical protein
VSWRRKKDTPITRTEVSDLIRLLMGMDWKLDRIMEEMGIENGEAQDRP